MSHFVVIVLGEDYGALLAPYDENREVEPYVDGDHEAGLEALAKARETIADPTALVGHAKPDFTATDQQVLDWWEGSGSWKHTGPEGTWQHWTAYPPGSRWDWYVEGGRWAGACTTMPDNTGTVADVLTGGPDGEPFIPFAVVTPDGAWHERGKMGWFAAVVGQCSA